MKSLQHYAKSGPFFFYGGPFSSFAERDIWLPPPYEGATETEPEFFSCREEYFQAAKAKFRADYDWVLEARQQSTWEVKKRGNEVGLRNGWDDHVAYPTMLRCILHETEVHPNLAELLEATGNRLIAEDSPTDFRWGCRDPSGGLGGENLLGLAWMHVRAYWTGRQSHPELIPVELHDAGWVRDKEVLAKLVRAESVFRSP